MLLRATFHACLQLLKGCTETHCMEVHCTVDPHITTEIEKPKTTKQHNKDASMVTMESFWTSQNNGNLDVTMPGQGIKLRFFKIHFTITGTKNFVHYTK